MVLNTQDLDRSNIFFLDTDSDPSTADINSHSDTAAFFSPTVKI